jgi:ligand-binding SRPBCC domain-containing protein
MAKYFELTDHFVVKADLDRTWDFFSSAENLPRITPAWMQFRILTPPPIVIQQDSILDYEIRWMGIPLRWRTRIIDWTPKRQFIDLQLRGPYALWHHQHTFTPCDEGTICTDRVTYQVPGHVVGRVMNALIVRKQLTGIFEFRRKVIAEELGWVRGVQEKVLIRSIG